MKKHWFLFFLVISLFQWCELLFLERDLLFAESHDISKFRLSGYGTLSVPVDDRGDMAPLRDISTDTGEGLAYLVDHPWQLDSRLGIQAEYRFSEKVEGAMQWVVRSQTDPDLSSRLENAYLRVYFTPTVAIRGGRFAYDAFLMSDIRNIGYAYLWVRPPTEFYGWIPIFSVDGLDLTWHIERDNAFWQVRAQGGIHRFNTSFNKEPYEFETTDLLSLTLLRQSGALQLKAGYSCFSSNNEVGIFEPLLAGLDAVALAADGIYPTIAMEAKDISGELSFKDAKVIYTTLGFIYDNGRWVAQGELARSRSTSDVLPHGIMGYIGAGIRLGDFTPFCMISHIRAENDVRKAVYDWSPMGQSAMNVQSQANYIINSTRMNQNTISLGLRWNFHNQAALKMQWDATNITSFGYGLWSKKTTLLHNSSHINLFTTSVEFIF